MAELWDPAIKLFGRTIAAVPPPPMPTPAAAAASDQVEPPEESPEGEKMMMFHTRVLLGGIEVYDRYHDWRLDVDNMSYEELLELGDKIGCVSTGLREEENELEGKAEVLLDSNTLSKDGTGALTMLAVRQDGKYLAYGLTENGSNWVTIKVMSIEDKQCQPDTLSWDPESSGTCYTSASSNSFSDI
ncbi:uncharacterized protein LOC109715526 isoform X2 [Ananas comosus]|uniref:Uncharacterized protein LOC109715526 isoform X2 n=1 Tax=Ananas comosus TaxID=4615 RepID=A0A6P5FIL4_ANACO|nr:uncharacterized protein LOC109715526 isoform X2 [Ananas comosus]